MRLIGVAGRHCQRCEREGLLAAAKAEHALKPANSGERLRSVAEMGVATAAKLAHADGEVVEHQIGDVPARRNVTCPRKYRGHVPCRRRTFGDLFLKCCF